MKIISAAASRLELPAPGPAVDEEAGARQKHRLARERRERLGDRSRAFSANDPGEQTASGLSRGGAEEVRQSRRTGRCAGRAPVVGAANFSRKKPL
ncbi:MAG: hypothetical protein HZA89_17350 [Verrucomicrobia bacterium]|nr:hypothetical protein [Verrucomicrobiota bacterium]